jgi:hypothetical protein
VHVPEMLPALVTQADPNFEQAGLVAPGLFINDLDVVGQGFGSEQRVLGWPDEDNCAFRSQLTLLGAVHIMDAATPGQECQEQE